MGNLVVAVLAVLLFGCVPYPYHETSPGSFEGELRLLWVGPDMFLVESDPAHPFRFVRAGGEVIEPGRTFTDGGSIPSAFWGVPGLSPWGYAPAYVIRDWLFERHRCGLAPGGVETFAESAEVLAEALRTLMGDEPDQAELERYRLIVVIAAGPFARYHWDHTPCRSFDQP